MYLMRSIGSRIWRMEHLDIMVTADTGTIREAGGKMNEKELVNDKEEMEIDLVELMRNFIRGILKFWWLILLLAVMGAGVMLARATVFYTPMYRAEASFTVATGKTGSDSGDGYQFYYNSSTAGQLERTFPYILSSRILTDAIEEDLGVENINGAISASAIPNSNLITMTVDSSNAEDAGKILDAAIRLYPDVARFVIGDIYFNMIDPPKTPEAPYNQPSYIREAAKGGAVGIVAALFLIGVAALLRKSVQKPEDLQQASNMICLGTLPKVRRKKGRSRRPSGLRKTR